MEIRNGLCWDHKQIENAFSIIWWHNKWETKAMYNKIICFSIVYNTFWTFGTFCVCLFLKSHPKTKKRTQIFFLDFLIFNFIFLDFFGIWQNGEENDDEQDVDEQRSSSSFRVDQQQKEDDDKGAQPSLFSIAWGQHEEEDNDKQHIYSSSSTMSTQHEEGDDDNKQSCYSSSFVTSRQHKRKMTTNNCLSFFL